MPTTRARIKSSMRDTSYDLGVLYTSYKYNANYVAALSVNSSLLFVKK
jgi:hypothetical protein